MHLLASPTPAIHRPAPRRMPRAALLAAALLPLLAQAQPATPDRSDDATDLDAIRVTAERDRSSAGALGERAIVDTPFSITRVDSAQLQDRQVNSLAQAFIADPSVSGNVGAYNSSWHSTIAVRGLRLHESTSFKLNGTPLYTYGSQWPYEMMEQVQLLKGAAGFMYGFGAPGGILDYITKKPTDTPLTSLTLGYRDGGVFSAHLDNSRRFGEDERFGYRINAVQENGDTYNDSHIDRSMFALGWDARLGETLTWTADLVYQNRELENESPVVYFADYTDGVLPRRLDARRSRAIHDTYYNVETQAAMTALKWRIDEQWSARLDLSYSKYRSAINKIWDYVQNREGDTTTYIYDLGNRAENYMARALLEGQVETGAVRHQLVAGLDWQQADSGWARVNSWSVLGYSNLYLPSGLEYHSSHSRDTYRGSRVEQTSAFASDTLHFGEHWQALLGLRHTRYRQDSWNPAGAHTGSYRKSATTPTLALLFKPRQDQTLYASYVESLERGSTVGIQYENRNALLPPLESHQYELGYKIDAPRWGMDAAVFRIERGAGYGNADNYYVQDGEVRYEGVDVGGRLQLRPGWTVGAGATWLDAGFLRTAPAVLGNRPHLTPKFQATLDSNYELAAVPGLSLHGAVKRYDAVMYEDDNLLELPGFTLVDAGANYRTRWSQRPVTFRAEITNLGDRRYWTRDGNGYGEPRTYALSVQLEL